MYERSVKRIRIRSLISETDSDPIYFACQNLGSDIELGSGFKSKFVQDYTVGI